MKRAFAMILAFSLILCICPLTVSANAPGPDIDGNILISPQIAVLFILISMAGIAATIVVEWSVSKLYELQKEYGKLIIGTNLLSQIMMRILQLFLPGIMPLEIRSNFLWYPVSVLMLELLVMCCEFLVYNWKMRNVPWRECLHYTVAANVASALAGLLLILIVL